eukprot:2273063-Heterocapsa_arctica.AAC.1
MGSSASTDFTDDMEGPQGQALRAATRKAPAPKAPWQQPWGKGRGIPPRHNKATGNNAGSERRWERRH